MSADELERAAARLSKSNPGDASTIRRAARAMRKGKANPTQIARAKKLASGVRS